MKTNVAEIGFGLRKFIIAFAACLLIFYGLYNARYLIFGPKIAIISPQSPEQVSEEKTLNLIGNVKNMTSLTVNGSQIFADPQGNFHETLLLLPGANYIEIKASDRFKNETKKTLYIYYDDKSHSQ